MTSEEAEIKDPKDQLEKECALSKPCFPIYQRLIACAERVSRNPELGETCTEELFDLSPCVDQCVASKLFLKLK